MFNTDTAETISLHRTFDIGGEQILRMTAEIYSEPNNETNYRVAVSNQELYFEHLAECRAAVEKFNKLVQHREDFMFLETNDVNSETEEDLVEEEEPVDPEPEV